MKIKLVTGATAYEAAVNTIKQIDVKDFDKENLVVVPDAFSMQAENLIFEALDIKATFNVEVVGISRLAAKILHSNNINFQRISGLEEVFCIYKAVKACEKDFLYFTKCDIDFCMKILQIIKQFKGCNICPEKIKSVGNENLDNKMHDLKLIYVAYQSLLSDKMDLSKLLEFFLQNSTKCKNLSKINLFFANFDSFSAEINAFICSLAEKVNSVCIGIAKPVSVKNAFIYEDDIFQKITTLAKEKNILVEVENFPTRLEGEKLDMVKNLFAIEVESKKSDFFANVICKNRQDEIEFVAKYIRQKVFQGRQFKSFAVACADESYFESVKDVFARYEIASYCDDAVNLGQTLLGRLLLKLLDIAKFGFDLQSLQYIVSHPLVGSSKETASQLEYLQIDNEQEFLSYFSDFEKIVNIVKSVALCRKTKDFESCLKQVLEAVHEKYNKFLFELDQDFKKQSENEQSFELVVSVLEKLTQLGGEENFSLEDYIALLKLAFSSVKVETIPSYIDAVFVGDATSSYFQDVDFLFVLGATAASLPKQRSDVGIIDDEDIKRLRLNFALEPEIKVINRRNRLKLFELLQHANEKLIVCTPINEAGRQTEKAGFVKDLLKLFDCKSVHSSSFEDFDLAIFSQEEELNRVLFNLGCKNIALLSYSKNKDKFPRNVQGTLHGLLKNSLSKQEKTKNISANVMKREDSISCSELETYFVCPFRHFVQYKLNINQKENSLPNRRQFGILVHAVLQKFVSQNKSIGKLTEKDVDKFLTDNVRSLAEKIYDAKTMQDKHFLIHLKKECKIVLKNVIKEQRHSNFEPYMLEQNIVQKLDDDTTLKGIVDRVDKCGKYFRIIDYKTGMTDTLKKELFYGKKLQLFLYADVIAKQTGLSAAGVYYFDCHTNYVNAGASQKLFNGHTLKNNDVVLMTDDRLDEVEVRSDILGMERKVKFGENEFAFKYGNPVENLQVEFDYAKEISLQALKEMREGYVEEKPFSDTCSFCPYFCVCRHADAQGYRKILKEKSAKKK